MARKRGIAERNEALKAEQKALLRRQVIEEQSATDMPHSKMVRTYSDLNARMRGANSLAAKAEGDTERDLAMASAEVYQKAMVPVEQYLIDIDVLPTLEL